MSSLVKEVKFSNYKSFSNDTYVSLVFDSPVNLIIGRNNSGKSSTIDILEYVFNADKQKTMVSNHSTDILIAVEITDSHLGAFDEYTSGGNIPGVNHRAFARQFIGKKLYVRLAPSWASTGRERFVKSDVKLAHIENDEECLTAGKDKWENVARSYSSYIDNVVFRRINAERNIVPEDESDNAYVSYDGEGATNLIRAFINDSKYDESLVEEVLLDQLNSIMGQDATFESIRIQQIGSGESKKWEIFLKEGGHPRFALSQSGSGLKTIVLMLVNLFLIPNLPDNKGKYFVFAFEELENNLHPALQRRVFDFLSHYALNNDCLIYLTSHSHVAINCFYEKDRTVIYHVFKDNGVSTIKPIESYFDKAEILNDLDVKASDLLQSNGVIWVEGPSDRIYIKRWLELIYGNQFKEGTDYQFLYYGGRLLSHYELGGDKSVDGLIGILTTNRNAAIVIDSDKGNQAAKINDTKKRIREEFESKGLLCWITKGKEIENYLTASSINKTFGLNKKKDIEKYGLFRDYVKQFLPNFEGSKVEVARKIAPNITVEDFPLDLRQQIERLHHSIEVWNYR